MRKLKKNEQKSNITQKEIEEILTGKEIKDLANALGVDDKRKSKFLVSQFVFVMLLANTLGKKLNFQELSMKAQEWKLTNENRITGERISQQMKERGHQLSKALFHYLLKKVLGVKGSANKRLRKHFNKIYSQDGSVIHLAQKLVDIYTGSKGQAALKIQVRYEYFSGASALIDISKAKYHDNNYKTPANLGKDILWLIDLGYYDFERFSKIKSAGQYFVSRLKVNADVSILEIKDHPEYANKKLSEILPLFAHSEIDCSVRLTNGDIMRVVCLWNEDKSEYWQYLTNINAEDFKALEIQMLYKMRWQIEIFFLELKHVFSTIKILSPSKEKIEAQLYFAFCYYLLIQLIRLKTALVCRIKWQSLSFCLCERIFRNWFVSNIVNEGCKLKLKKKISELIDKIRRNAYISVIQMTRYTERIYGIRIRA